MHKQQRSTLLLLIICILLAAGVGALLWNNNQRQNQRTADADVVDSFDTAAVNLIELTKDETSTVLKKEGDAWVIASQENTPADVVAIERLISTINTATIEVTTSQRANATASQYGLDEGARLHVVLKSTDTVVADLFIGKPGNLPNTVYAQPAGENTIYLLNATEYEINRPDWKKQEETNTNTSTE